MLEKMRMFPSRNLFFLVSVSTTFLLIFSSLFLLKPNDHTLVPRSVFELFLSNGSSVSLSLNTERFSYDPLPSETVTIKTTFAQRSDTYKNVVSESTGHGCHPGTALLKVFMYDLPPEFHFGFLHWKGSEPNQTWPEASNRSLIPPYPGGLNLQHSVEYWLTSDLLASNAPYVARPCTAVRVMNASQADITFVPFFSSLSYNRCRKLRARGKDCADKLLQRKLVTFLQGRDEWNRFNGTDHLVVAHHPNSMLEARTNLSSAIFVLADFGRYPAQVANINKDVIAPYKHIVESTPVNESAPFEKRPTLVYFQGAINRKDGGIIRRELYQLLKKEADVHFRFGSARGRGVITAAKGMAASKFCLNIAGDTPSSNRLFDAIASHCVPVIISDNIELPFEDRLDYSEFCIFVRETDALRKGYLLSLLRNITQDHWTQIWGRLKQVEKHFEYWYPSQPGDSVDMIWREIWHKISSRRVVSNKLNKDSNLQHLQGNRTHSTETDEN